MQPRHNKRKKILISHSDNAEDKNIKSKAVDLETVIRKNDPNSFIYIPINDDYQEILKRIHKLPCSLYELGLTVSTGRVVDFRATHLLADIKNENIYPLIYANHFKDGYIVWPNDNFSKPQALCRCKESESLMVHRGHYVLVKRFSAKEEKKRVVACILDPDIVDYNMLGFENHLNYFHSDNIGINKKMAKGLALFLNSTIVDQYLRQFNGHTQVNAADLVNLKYPSRQQLEKLGQSFRTKFPNQKKIDSILEDSLFFD